MDPKEFFKPQFTTSETLELVGVNLTTLRRWVQLGYLHLTMENPGRGRTRLYSMADVVQVATIHLLSGLGFDPSWYSATIGKLALSLAIHKIIETHCREKNIEYRHDPESPYGPDRYILIFKNAAGEVENQVSTTPCFNRGAWIVLDVHGIVIEMLKQIPNLLGPAKFEVDNTEKLIAHFQNLKDLATQAGDTTTAQHAQAKLDALKAKIREGED